MLDRCHSMLVSHKNPPYEPFWTILIAFFHYNNGMSFCILV